MRRTWWILDVSPRPEGSGLIGEHTIKNEDFFAQVMNMALEPRSWRISHERGGPRHFVAITLQ